MIGTTDDRFLIDRVGTDVEVLLGYQPAEVLGRSIFSFVDRVSTAAMRSAFQAALRSRVGVFAVVDLRSKTGPMLRCDAVVVPLVPAPSCAFAFVPEGGDVASKSRAAQRFVDRLQEGVTAVERPEDTAPIGSQAELPGITKLTAREWEIVRRLVSGDRVPAIADRLFLSQSTVRNHLSSVFRKLGVRSQQELVDRLRNTDTGAGSGDVPTTDQ